MALRFAGAAALTLVVSAVPTYYVYPDRTNGSAFVVMPMQRAAEAAIAWGTVVDTIAENGWSSLEVFTNASFSDTEQMLAAGFFEGALLTERIWETTVNQGLNGSAPPWPAVTQQWLDDNTAFMNESIAAYGNDDPYWYHARLLLAQLQGVYEGYASAQSDPAKALSYTNVLALNLPGDLQDLLPGVTLQALRRNEAARQLRRQGQASAAEGAGAGGASAYADDDELLADPFWADVAGAMAVESADAAASSLADSAANSDAAAPEPAVHEPAAPLSYGSSPAERRSTAGALRSLRRRIATRTDPATGERTYSLVPPPPQASKLSHCSGLVRRTDDGSEVFIGHATWAGAEVMTRTWKRYHMPLRLLPDAPGQVVPAVTMSFSGYPGSLASSDDFYQLSSGLAVIETTIGNNNNTLYELYMRPQSVLEWMRNLIANRLATSAPSWAATFSRLNSGTYNNEWLVVDYNRVTPGQPLPADSFWVIDQVPGYISAYDRSELLQERGWFASYNTASDPFIFNVSGWQSMVDQYGTYFSYAECPRARIFARDAPTVANASAMGAILRYNDFKHDPDSRQGCGANPPYNAQEAIASRGDLNPSSGDWIIPWFGLDDTIGIDAKYTSTSMMQGVPPTPAGSRSGRKGGAAGSLTGRHRAGGGSAGGKAGAASLRAHDSKRHSANAAAPARLGGIADVVFAVAQSGPSHDIQPPFDWRATNLTQLNLTHIGMPDLWDFGWVTFQAEMP